MSSGEDKEKEKKRKREARNNLAAKQSRERKKMLKAHLTAEKARLLEGNALLRAQIDCLKRVQAQGGGSSGAGPSSAPRQASSVRSGVGGGCTGSSSAAGMVRGGDEMLQLSDNMSRLLGRREISGRVAVDMLDRAVTGSQGKGPPEDPELCQLWDAAQARAPVVPRPQYYPTVAEAAKHAMEIAEKKRRDKEKKERLEAEKRARKASAAAKKGGPSKRH